MGDMEGNTEVAMREATTEEEGGVPHPDTSTRLMKRMEVIFNQ